MATTVKDIALAAGVSKAAVSKVLHNSSASVRVSEFRAQQIRDLALKMGYVANANARILRSSRTYTIGIYFEDLEGIAAGPLYTTHLLDGACRVLFKRHYRAALIAELDNGQTANSLGDGRLEGVIWCRVVRDQSVLDLMRNSPIPIVALNATPAEEESPVVYVRCDNAGGIDLAVQHLWDLGHRKILFLHEEQEGNVADCIDRLAGFKASMGKRGIEVGSDDVASWGWEMEEFGLWWNSNPDHTAVIAWSESCAGRLLKQCARCGVDIPGKLSLVGFDSTQYCETTKPQLTAVKQPIIEMASLAARLLADILDGVKPDQKLYTLPCPLDIRESTAPPRT